MNYSELSDFEINKMVAEKLGLKLCEGQHYRPKVAAWIDCHLETKSYCADWGDMGPIIEENKITITFRSRGDKDLPPQAKRFGSDDFNIANVNPLRAAAIVFLEMEA